MFINGGSQISNIMTNMKVQSYDSNDNLVVITADRAIIKDKGATANNVKLDSKSLKANSTLVEFDEKNNEIILKNRPEIIFYGVKD